MMDYGAFEYVDSSQLDSEMTNAPKTVLCCNCGVAMKPNALAMCVNCIRSSTDITEGIARESTVHFCRGCNRFLRPPTQWVNAELESRELLAICLKKLGKFHDVRLTDAQFIWTEPHSRRIKMRITIQKEVATEIIIQQSFEVEFVVANQQCRDCAKQYTAHTWQAAVQVRQKVNHKRTFFYLEQLILKSNAHVGCINIKEAKDGIDFFFASRNDALKFTNFLSNTVPLRMKTSEELISRDQKSNIANFKYTYSIEIAPICRDDLVCLPLSLAKSLGATNQLMLCYKIGTTLHFVDPRSMATIEVNSNHFWRAPFSQLLDIPQLVEFSVLNVELLGPTSRGMKWALADIEVARSADLTSTGHTYIVRSHLGSVLQPGDSVMGYHLTNTNFNNDSFDQVSLDNLVDVILVRKAYPNRRKHKKRRHWRLKTLAKEESEMAPRKQDLEKREREYEMFLRDIEEDVELRQTINLYKAKEVDELMGNMTLSETVNENNELAHAADNGTDNNNNNDDNDNDNDNDNDDDENSDDEPEPDFPEIDVTELLDDMEDMTLED